MNNLKSAIEARKRRAFRVPSLSASKTKDAVSKLTSPRKEVTLSPVNLAELHGRLIKAATSDTFHALPLRDIDQGLRTLWLGKPPLATAPAMADSLSVEALRRSRRRLSRSLVRAYLAADFTTDKGTLIRIGNFAARAAEQSDPEWHQRGVRFNLFDVVKGPKAIAKYVLEEQADPWNALAELELDEGSAIFGFVEAAFAEACAVTEKGLVRDFERFGTRLMAWALRDTSFIFEKRRLEVVNALLLPWESRNPTSEHQTRVLRFIKNAFGDPRMRNEKWPLDATRAAAVIRRWLARESFDLFMDIVGKSTARDDQWKYRRQFWESYLSAGYIQDAWVAFGPEAEVLAKVAAQKAADYTLRYGRLTRATDATHSVLLMKIGDLLVVERSHNGRRRVWPDGAKSGIKLGRHAYESSDLMNAPEEGAHTGSEQFLWQGRVSKIIKDAARVSTPRDSWIP